jgi:hypothetical protein
VPLSDEDRAAIEAHQSHDANSILAVMVASPDLSLMDIAKRLGWKNVKGEHDKKRVQKGMNRLKRYKLVAMDPTTRHYKPTKKGEDVAPTIKGEATTRTISTTRRTVPASQ